MTVAGPRRIRTGFLSCRRIWLRQSTTCANARQLALDLRRESVSEAHTARERRTDSRGPYPWRRRRAPAAAGRCVAVDVTADDDQIDPVRHGRRAQREAGVRAGAGEHGRAAAARPLPRGQAHDAEGEQAHQGDGGDEADAEDGAESCPVDASCWSGVLTPWPWPASRRGVAWRRAAAGMVALRSCRPVARRPAGGGVTARDGGGDDARGLGAAVSGVVDVGVVDGLAAGERARCAPQTAIASTATAVTPQVALLGQELRTRRDQTGGRQRQTPARRTSGPRWTSGRRRPCGRGPAPITAPEQTCVVESEKPRWEEARMTWPRRWSGRRSPAAAGGR